jgi:hypothetical protein
MDLVYFSLAVLQSRQEIRDGTESILKIPRKSKAEFEDRVLGGQPQWGAREPSPVFEICIECAMVSHQVHRDLLNK